MESKLPEQTDSPFSRASVGEGSVGIYYDGEGAEDEEYAWAT